MQTLINQVSNQTLNVKSYNYRPNKDLQLIQLRLALVDYFGLSIEQLESKSRLQRIVNIRAVFSFFCYENMVDYQDSKVAKWINRDRTSVMHLVNKMKDAKTYNPELWQMYKDFCLFLEVNNY